MKAKYVPVVIIIQCEDKPSDYMATTGAGIAGGTR